jgi:hypothetical protein
MQLTGHNGDTTDQPQDRQLLTNVAKPLLSSPLVSIYVAPSLPCSIPSPPTPPHLQHVAVCDGDARAPRHQLFADLGAQEIALDCRRGRAGRAGWSGNRTGGLLGAAVLQPLGSPTHRAQAQLPLHALVHTKRHSSGCCPITHEQHIHLTSGPDLWPQTHL